MRALFDHGYRLAQGGYPWSTSPPGVGTMVPAGPRRRGE
jgi:hypothetical protein